MEKIKGKFPRLKVRMGVMPTKVERDRKVYSRKAKHKADYRAERCGRESSPVLFGKGRGLGSCRAMPNLLKNHRYPEE